MRPSKPVKLLTVVCGYCVTEHRKKPSILGELWKYPSGRIRWFGRNHKNVRRWRRREVELRYSSDNITLSVPDESNFLPEHLRHRAPETLRAFCHYHGVGRLASAEVTESRGSLSVKFQATT